MISGQPDTLISNQTPDIRIYFMPRSRLYPAMISGQPDTLISNRISGYTKYLVADDVGLAAHVLLDIVQRLGDVVGDLTKTKTL